MKHSFLKNSLFLVVSFTIAAMTISCSNKKLIPLATSYSATVSPYVSINSEFCVSPGEVNKQKIKYVFILDKSDSNQPGIPTSQGDVTNTDPVGNRRYGPLVQFLRNLQTDPNVTNSFSLIGFNSEAFVPTGPNTVSGFDSNKSRFESVVRAEWSNLSDSGFTDYRKALIKALEIIKKDALEESGTLLRPIVTSSYRIIFVSDGVPRIESAAGFVNQDFNNDILPIINDILSLKNEPALSSHITEVVLNTAYYFSSVQITEASTLLQKMASEGYGQFLKFGVGENVIYQAFAPPITNVRRVLSDVFVESDSASWWDDGVLHLDSDADGLPDSIEDEFGSDSQLKDSDGNGVSDLVEYRLKGRPCDGATCSERERNPFSVCDGLFPVADGLGSLTFPDTDKDGLNNCEEFILKSESSKFDSNNDNIPDFIAFKAGLAFIAGTDNSALQLHADGLTNYAKIKAGLPLSVASHKLKDFRSRKTTLTKLTKTVEGRDCYSLTVDPVSVLAPNQFVRIYIVENASSISDNSKIRIAEKRVDFGMTSIAFNEGEFK